MHSTRGQAQDAWHAQTMSDDMVVSNVVVMGSIRCATPSQLPRESGCRFWHAKDQQHCLLAANAWRGSINAAAERTCEGPPALFHASNHPNWACKLYTANAASHLYRGIPLRLRRAGLASLQILAHHILRGQVPSTLADIVPRLTLKVTGLGGAVLLVVEVLTQAIDPKQGYADDAAVAPTSPVQGAKGGCLARTKTQYMAAAGVECVYHVRLWSMRCTTLASLGLGQAVPSPCEARAWAAQPPSMGSIPVLPFKQQAG